MMLHVPSTEGANSHTRSGQPTAHFVKAVWRAATALLLGWAHRRSKHEANGPRVNLSGTEDRGSGTV
jgi:hypothetical protein